VINAAFITKVFHEGPGVPSKAAQPATFTIDTLTDVSS
jgi:hypothetical protein